MAAYFIDPLNCLVQRLAEDGTAPAVPEPDRCARPATVHGKDARDALRRVLRRRAFGGEVGGRSDKRAA
jgi:hypothetical protein